MKRGCRPLPRLLYADAEGRFFDAPGLAMAGSSGGHFVRLTWEDLIPLPPGSDLYLLPDREPVGFDEATGRFEILSGLHAVAAFTAPAYTLRAWAAFRAQKGASRLPLNAYGAVGFQRGRYFVAAFRSDPDPRQDIEHLDFPRMERSRAEDRARFPGNRALEQMEVCAFQYGCPAARNYFHRRWEAPMPLSAGCNSRCVGCLSLQPDGAPPSPMERLRRAARAADLAALLGPHLASAERAVASFGQGCEGEPLTQVETLCDVIRRLRAGTSRGTVNLNSNASRPQAVEDAAKAGLDSLRVSLNSARKRPYEAYYRPVDYRFEDVVESIRRAKRRGVFVSLNYFIFPGFTDQPEERDAFLDLLDESRPDYVQLRNLNIDPDLYLDTVGRPEGPGFGMDRWLEEVHRRHPWVRFGYFNPPKEWWGRSGMVPPEHRLYSEPRERAEGFPRYFTQTSPQRGAGSSK